MRCKVKNNIWYLSPLTSSAKLSFNERSVQENLRHLGHILLLLHSSHRNKHGALGQMSHNSPLGCWERRIASKIADHEASQFFPFWYHITIVILTKSSNQSKKINYKNILLVPVIIHPLIIFTVYNNRTFYSTDLFCNAFQTNFI